MLDSKKSTKTVCRMPLYGWWHFFELSLMTHIFAYIMKRKILQADLSNQGTNISHLADGNKAEICVSVLFCGRCPIFLPDGLRNID